MSGDSRHAQSLVGSVLEGGYRVERLLGEGGMGAVYEATHLRLGKRVAVKVMARELAANQEALARFHREAVVTSGLGDPNIVQVFDFNATPEGEPFLVMEFLHGEDLEQRLRRTGRLSAADTLSIVSQVASALAAAHAQSIVHRDLKPANIYLIEMAGRNDFVKILDFGISKVRSAATKLTKATSIIGTPRYMSPEQARGRSEDIDERTDQWALACIAWECLAGESPFMGEDLAAVMYQIVHEAPPALASQVPGLNPAIETVLMRALSKDKSGRFSSVGEFAATLKDAVAGRASMMMAEATGVRSHEYANRLKENAASPTTFSRTAAEMVEPDEIPAGRGKTTMYAVAVAALAVLLLGGFLLFRPAAVSKPVVASPPVVIPPAPIVTPLPSPKPEPTAVMPAAAQPEAEPPSTAAPSSEPKLKKSARSPKPRPMASPMDYRLPEVEPPPAMEPPKPAEPPNPPSKESQKRWRLD